MEELARLTGAFEHAAIRPLYLLNGGALIAVLAFAGNSPGIAPQVVDAMLFWVAGLALATLTTFAGYFSQHSFYKAYQGLENGKRIYNVVWTDRGFGTRYAAFVFGFLSLVQFVLGAREAITVFGKIA